MANSFDKYIGADSVLSSQVERMSDSPDSSSSKSDAKRSQQRNAVISFMLRPSVLLFVFCFLGFIFHPKWMNIRFYFGSSEELVPMNYVSNFYLWTRSNPEEPEKLVVGAVDQLSQSKFRPRLTFILIHGFTRTGLVKWVISMKNALLWREDCNVISVDWEAGSMSVGYYVIQARVPEVGEDVSKLVGFLQTQTALSGNDFHVIGHSLGAHVAGYAGKYLNGTLSRITGLDPAGLAYNGASPDARLADSDASFVDVIHTHGCYTIINQFSDCYGTYDNMGDADFWPNGGHYQSACEEDGDGKITVREGSNCDHGLAYVYYTESIKYYPTTTRFLARRCDSYEFFNNGSCDCPAVPQYLGYNVNRREHGVFYLNMSKTTPYGILEPSCSPAQYSLVKILGLAVCFLLTIFGFAYSSLLVASSLLKKDLIEVFNLKWNEHFANSDSLTKTRID